MIYLITVIAIDLAKFLILLVTEEVFTLVINGKTAL